MINVVTGRVRPDDPWQDGQAINSMNFASCIAACRLPFACFAGFSCQLDFMGVDDGHNQSWEAFIDFGATRGVVHLDPSTLTPDQARLSECLEVLREG